MKQTLLSLPRTPQRHSGFGYPAEPKCYWPGCDDPALCESGNVDALVCLKHFNEVNGGTDAGHLMWIHDRLVHVYGESENVDFIIRLRSVIDRMIDDKQESKPTGFTRTQSALAKLIDIDAKLTDYGREQIKSHPRSGLLT